MRDAPRPAMDALEYSPLPASGGFLRLLDILPADNAADIECRLREASLYSQISYKALSYAWIEDGNDEAIEKNKTFVCNGKQSTIHGNLHSALCAFRDAHSIVTLWVDYICINQQDNKERSQQVKMMRAIYSHCSEVLIWLGPNRLGDHIGRGRVLLAENIENDDSKCVWHNDNRDEIMVESYFESFRIYERETSESEHYSRGSHKTKINTWSRDTFGAFCVLNRLAQGVPSKDLRVIQANMTSTRQISWARDVSKGFWAIMDSSWWQRTWVIQESVVARKATVYLGYMSAPWTMLSAAASTYIHELAASDLISDVKARDPITRLVKAVLDIESVRVARVDELRPPFLSTLRRFRTRKSSDPRDKVFGLLGLADQQVHAALEPDYSLSRKEVMLRTTVALISKVNGLEALAGGVAGPLSEPSWITNWDDPPRGNEAERLSCLQLYNASLGLVGTARLHGTSLLELEGFFVDIINFVDVEAPEDGLGRTKAALGQWENNMYVSLRNSQYQDQGDAFWRTISADTTYVESSEDSSLHLGRCKYRRANADGLAAFKTWEVDDTGKRNRKSSVGPGGLMKSYIEPESISMLKNSFYNAFLAASASRKFFGTETGFIGVGPVNVQKGDKVFIILGSRVPLILRPIGSVSSVCNREPVRDLLSDFQAPLSSERICAKSHFDIHALVGDAYVHGVMDGEIVHRSQRPFFKRFKATTIYVS